MLEPLAPSRKRRALAGFVISGFLFALPGALLPVWQYHLSEQYEIAGAYFLMMVSGMALSAISARHLIPRHSISRVLALSCGLACAALLSLALVPQTGNAGWRMAGLLAIGLAAGLVNTGLFHALLPFYDQQPARVLTLAGFCFGAGSLISPVLVAGTYYLYSIEAILLALAMVPLVYNHLIFANRLCSRCSAGADRCARVRS